MKTYLILAAAALTASLAQAAGVTATYTGRTPIIDRNPLVTDPGKALQVTVFFDDSLVFERNQWVRLFLDWDIHFGTVDHSFGPVDSKHAVAALFIDGQGHIAQWRVDGNTSQEGFLSVYATGEQQMDTVSGYREHPVDDDHLWFNYTSTQGPGTWVLSGPLPLTPVPEASASALALAGLMAVGAAMRHRRRSGARSD